MLIILGWIWLGMLLCFGVCCIAVVLFLVSVLFEGFSQRW